MAQAQLATLRVHMQGWSAQLHRLQPKCIMDSILIDHAIVFFLQAVRLRKEMVRPPHRCTASLSVSLRHQHFLGRNTAYDAAAGITAQIIMWIRRRLCVVNVCLWLGADGKWPQL